MPSAAASTGISSTAMYTPVQLCAHSVSHLGCVAMGTAFHRHVHDRNVSTSSDAFTA